MEKGLVFAIVAATSFAGSTIYVRKAVAQTGESFTAVAISVFTGVPFFALVILFSGEWHKLWALSWTSFALLGVAGIVHLVAGRLFAYNSYRLIGANKSSALLRTSPVYAAILGVVFLDEQLTILIVSGILCIVGAGVLVSVERKSVSDVRTTGFSLAEIKGLLTALGGGLCWGISPVLIKPAVAGLGSPFVGGFISYVVASIAMTIFFLRRGYRQLLTQLQFFTALTPLIISAVFVSIAQLFYYAALSYSPASMVAPLLGTSVFFIYPFSFLTNRSIEVFSPKVILGMLATVLGTFLICGFR